MSVYVKKIEVKGITQQDEYRPQEDPNYLGSTPRLHWFEGSLPEDGRLPTQEEQEEAVEYLPDLVMNKKMVRRRIESEVGDLHEIVADQAKQIEALTSLVAHLATEYLGGTPMSPEVKSVYLQRVEGILASLKSDQFVMRGDLEDTDEMIEKVFARSTKINAIVGEHYLPKKKEFLNNN